MRKSLTTVLVAGLMLPVGLVASEVRAENIGNEGCTPGYWKNHTDNWEEAKASTTLADAKVGFITNKVPGSTTLLAALQLRGGPGLAGAERILMRAAAAAWLNAAHEGLGYPYRRIGTEHYEGLRIIEEVNAAIASQDRSTMLSLAKVLDQANNLGCPLN